MQYAGKAQRLHLKVGHAIRVTILEKFSLLVQCVAAKCAVNSRLTLVKVMATHRFAFYDVKLQTTFAILIFQLIAELGQLVNDLLITFGLSNHFFA